MEAIQEMMGTMLTGDSSMFITAGFIMLIIWTGIKAYHINKRLYRYITKQYEDEQIKTTFTLLSEEMKASLQHNPTGKLNTQTIVEAAISNTCDDKGENLLKGIKKVKGTPSTLIILGVLGTFTGLVMGLMALSDADLLEQIPVFLQGVHTAFWTSIVGIIGSLLLQNKINQYSCEGEMVKWMLKLEILLNEQIKDDEKIQFKQFMIETTKQLGHLQAIVPLQEDTNRLMRLSVEEMSEINNGLSALKELKHVAKDLNVFNKGFGKNIGHFTERMAESFKMMEDFTAKMDNIGQLFERLRGDMASQYQLNMDIKDYVQEARNNLVHATNSVIQQQHIQAEMYDTWQERLRYMQEDIEGVLDSITQAEEARQASMHIMQDEVKAFVAQQNTYQESVYERVQDKLQQLFAQIATDMDTTMNALQTRMEAIQMAFIAISRKIPEQMHTLETHLIEQSKEQCGVLTEMVKQESEASERYAQGFQTLFMQLEQMLTLSEDKLACMDKSLVQERETNQAMLDKMTDYIEAGLKEKNKLAQDHIELVQKLGLLADAVDEKVGDIDKNFAESMERTFDQFKEYLRRTNRILEHKLELVSDDRMLEKIAQAIQYTEKE